MSSKLTIPEVIKGVFAPLTRRAVQNDRDAAIQLICAAGTLCDCVEEVRKHQPSLARSLARRLDLWPCRAGRHLAAIRNLEQALDDLQLAEDHPDRALLAPGRKGSDLDRELNSVALEIRDLLLRLKSPRFADHPLAQLIVAHLPEQLTPATFDDWWSAGWTLFLAAHNGDPFRHPRLQALRSNLERNASPKAKSAEKTLGRQLKQAARTLWLSRFREN